MQMPVCHVRMMSGGFMVAGLVVAGGFAMVLCRVLKVFCRFAVVLCCLFGHGCLPIVI
jgi:hypothetical protein